MIPAPLDAAVADALLAVGVLFAAVVGLGVRRLAARLRDVQRDTITTRRQVQNTHDTNLRDDLDRIRDQLAELLHVVYRLDGRQQAAEASATREHRNLWSAVNELRAATPHRKEPK